MSERSERMEFSVSWNSSKRLSKNKRKRNNTKIITKCSEIETKWNSFQYVISHFVLFHLLFLLVCKRQIVFFFYICFVFLLIFFWIFFLLPILGYNGRIEYSITAGNDNADFEINENGTLRTRRILDRETTDTYNLIVTARDMAREPEKRLSSTVQVCFLYV